MSLKKFSLKQKTDVEGGGCHGIHDHVQKNCAGLGGDSVPVWGIYYKEFSEELRLGECTFGGRNGNTILGNPLSSKQELPEVGNRGGVWCF